METIVFLAIIIGACVALWFAHQARERSFQRVRDASDAYQNALRELRSNPASPDLKERALRLGRAYAAMTRESKAATLFDEVALGNDISAATAAASVTKAPAAPVKPGVTERLKQLDQLRAQGMVTEAEHAARRVEILKDI